MGDVITTFEQASPHRFRAVSGDRLVGAVWLDSDDYWRWEARTGEYGRSYLCAEAMRSLLEATEGIG
jgi:hypothetical protein